MGVIKVEVDIPHEINNCIEDISTALSHASTCLGAGDIAEVYNELSNAKMYFEQLGENKKLLDSTKFATFTALIDNISENPSVLSLQKVADDIRDLKIEIE